MKKNRKLYAYLSVLLILIIGGYFVLNNVFGIINVFRDARLKAAGYESGYYNTDSSSIYYYKGGSGPKKVLLIHGFGVGGATTWFDAMLGLNKDVELLVPDLMWFGKSDGKYEPTLTNQAKVVRELCDYLGYKPDVIAGISYGGFVALEILNQDPNLYSELVIVNSPGVTFGKADVELMCQRAGAESADMLFVPNEASKLGQLLKFVTSGGIPDLPDFFLNQMFTSETLKHAENKRKLMRDLVGNSEEYKSHMNVRYKSAGVIWSKNDSVFPLRYGMQLADILDAPLYTLENSGHIPMPSDREVYVERLRDLFVK